MTFSSLYRLACVLLVCAVAAWGRQSGPVASQEPRREAIAPPREVWAVDLLKRLGNERPTGETVAMVVEWTLAEDSGDGAFERGNPLNTTQPSFAETMTINSDGVKGYESHSAGLDATVRTLTNGLYDGVVAALLANDPDAAKRALWASDWASSHYSGGANWPVYQIEETQVARVSPIRAQIVNDALAQVGKPYVMGAAGADAFDCSGLVQWVYAKQGIATGRTTFDQLERLPAVASGGLQAGDLIYFAFPWDQHVGILADIDSDGRWDMVNAGAPGIGVVVTQDVFADPFWTNAIIGYRRAI